MTAPEPLTERRLLDGAMVEFKSRWWHEPWFEGLDPIRKPDLEASLREALGIVIRAAWVCGYETTVHHSVVEKALAARRRRRKKQR